MAEKSYKEISERTTLVYEELVNNYSNCECVKYSAYRTASKLHLIQRFLWFDHIGLQVINGVLTKHSVFTIDNSSVLCVEELKNILHDIYFVSLKNVCSSNFIKVDVLVNLCLKFLESAYRTGRFNVLDVKVALACLCSCPPQQKFKYWFSQLADHNLCLSRGSFRHFLVSLCSLSKYLSESERECDGIVDSTLESFSRQFGNSVGLDEVEFLSWAGGRPHFLTWLSVFYRFCSSKSVAHPIKCSVCLRNPIVGLRYSCLECLSYNLCQTCFFGGKFNKNHRTSHPMYEYCMQVSCTASATDYIKTLVKKWCSQSKSLRGQEGACSREIERGEAVMSGVDMDGSLVPSDRLAEVIEELEEEADRLRDRGASTTQVQFLRSQAKRLHDVRLCLVSCASSSTPLALVIPPPSVPLSPVSLPRSPATPSEFSAWLHDSPSSRQESTRLQADLDKILTKLNKMLETSFWTYD